jgi:hypothetical protein
MNFHTERKDERPRSKSTRSDKSKKSELTAPKFIQKIAEEEANNYDDGRTYSGNGSVFNNRMFIEFVYSQIKNNNEGE